MKIPKKAVMLLERNISYPIVAIHFKTKQVTLKESDKVYNTVSAKNVHFDYTGFDECDIRTFRAMFH